MQLTHDEIQRYSRHLILPEVGMEGQKKLKAARVLCVGAGGLGSPLSLYLAAAGVGTIGLVDFDVVDTSNLQRQVLYTTHDVGKPKLEVAKQRLQALNPHLQVITHESRLNSQNAFDILEGYDIVADGTDNFPTRYLVNDACVFLGKPNVYASIFRFEGQVSIFGAKDGPCYRCLYPEPPPPGLVPSCAEGGVLGVLPGVVGCLQAMEAIKLIIGKGEPLVGRLLRFDALTMKFYELKLRKDPHCVLCSDNRVLEGLIDYEQFCGLPAGGQPGMEEAAQVGFDEISVRELAARLQSGQSNFQFIDVREPHEYEIARIEGATLMPMHTVAQRYQELDPAQETVVHCHHGGRSAKICGFLKQQGFKKVFNVSGGIDQWSLHIDPKVPRY